MPKTKTKTLKVKKPLPKIQVLTNQPTQAELKRAYSLVTSDLFQQLVTMKEGTIYISPKGSLGSFKKTERKVKSGITPKGAKVKPKLRTYVYYSVHFKPSKKLKEELNQSLERKYNK